MGKFFALLSGESVRLSQEEVISVLESNQIPVLNVKLYDRVLDFEVEGSPDVSRAAMMHFICEEIYHASEGVPRILEDVSRYQFRDYLKENETFCVRITRVNNAVPAKTTPLLERKLGNLIQDQTQCKVNLKHPDVLFRGVFAENDFFLGVQLHENPRSLFDKRKPSQREYFMPTSMHPLLARSMVNLAKPQENTLFLDPFVGTGGIVIEAEKVGCRCIGSDVKVEVVRGARKNVSHRTSLIIADGKNIPLRFVECISTDPPYGKNSAILGELDDVLIGFLQEADRMLKPSRWVCLATDSNIKMEPLFSNFKKVESFDYYVHKSLTRRIWVGQTVKI
jgi:tRNA (guanine10-N2)-dimethyltransferase